MISNLPKSVRIGLAGAVAYIGAVGLVNLAPEKMNYVPVLSNVTPVAAEVTKGGVTRNEIISHAEFTRINAEGAQVQLAIQEIETAIALPFVGYSYVGGSYQEFRFDTNLDYNARGLNEITYDDGSKEYIALYDDGTFVSEVWVDGEKSTERGFWEVKDGEYVLFSEGLQTHFPFMALVEAF